MAFMRSRVRLPSGPPTFALDCRRRLPTIARSAKVGLSPVTHESFGWQATLRAKVVHRSGVAAKVDWQATLILRNSASYGWQATRRLHAKAILITPGRSRNCTPLGDAGEQAFSLRPENG